MNHIDKDILYKYSLDILEDFEISNVRKHLSKCNICSENFRLIKKQINLLESFDPDVKSTFIPPHRKHNLIGNWLKVAAVLLVGLLIGYSTYSSMQDDQIIVVGQTLNPQNNLTYSTEFVECPNVDIHTQY